MSETTGLVILGLGFFVLLATLATPTQKDCREGYFLAAEMRTGARVDTYTCQREPRT